MGPTAKVHPVAEPAKQINGKLESSNMVNGIDISSLSISDVDWEKKTWNIIEQVVKSKGSMEVTLPGAEKGVCTRFPPEPSGRLHIGHAKAALLNDYFARKYKGKMLLRFDDTNSDKATQSFEDSIFCDLKKMNINYHQVSYTSDHFDTLLKYAEDFIRNGFAYCDATDPVALQKQRLKRIESEYRNQTVEENLKIWEQMKNGDEEAGQYILRAKIDMKHNNGCMRDPTLYRTKKTPHHRTGTKYIVYPTYDFACPIVDSIEGVTHALRSLEYSDRKEQYAWVVQAAKLEHVPQVWEFSRLEFTNTCLSKRKLTQLVDDGLAEDWDDPRFPTIQGVARRGMSMLALRAFVLSQGASRNVTVQQWDKIWTVNKRVIDADAPRHVALERATMKKVTVTNAEEEVKVVPKHKKNPEVGQKSVIYSKNILMEGEDAASVEVDEIVTFMDWGNMKVLSKDDNGNITVEYQPENKNFKKTKKVTWLAATDDLVPILVKKYGELLTRSPKKDDKSSIQELFNKDSLSTLTLTGDINLKMLQKNDIIQLERRGFYRCDKVLVRDGNDKKPLVLIEIPDGKTKR